jgi:hypothetical protein
LYDYNLTHDPLATSAYYNISVVSIAIDLNYSSFYKIGVYYNSFILDSSTNSFLTTQPLNFGIPVDPDFSSGYDGYCIIGIKAMIFAYNSDSFVRTAWFNAKTQPISDIQNDVLQTSGVYERFKINYAVLCIKQMNCGYNMAVNYTTFQCQLCTIPNCADCYTFTICKSCAGSYAWNGTHCVVSCKNATQNTCGVCTNTKFCQKCLDDTML